MSATRVELKRKRYGEARKSAGSVARRIASEMVLWVEVCVKEVEMWRRKEREKYKWEPG